MMTKPNIEQHFEKITIADIDQLAYYLDKCNYIESNHNLLNMIIWLDYYPLFKCVTEKYMLLLGVHDGAYFMYMPLCEDIYVNEALEYAKEIFAQYDYSFSFSCYTEDMMQKVFSIFNNYRICNQRSTYDYIYFTDSFRSFSGKKLQKKRNHLNFFYKTYEYTYEPMSDGNIAECIEFAQKWKSDSEDLFIISERKGIVRALELFGTFDYKGGVIRVNDQVEGFVMGSMLTKNVCQENVEKANSEFRGIYQALLNQFLLHEYIEVEYINREDDLGLENLRFAKMAYNPKELLEKYWLCV